MLEAAESDMSKLHGRHNPNRASSSPDFDVLSNSSSPVQNIEKGSNSNSRPPQRHSSPTTSCGTLSQSDCSERFANMTLDRAAQLQSQDTRQMQSTTQENSRVPDPTGNGNGFSLSQVEVTNYFYFHYIISYKDFDDSRSGNFRKSRTCQAT